MEGQRSVTLTGSWDTRISRRVLLRTGGSAAAGLLLLGRTATAGASAAVGQRQPVQPRRRLRRSDAGRVRALDAAAAGGHAARRQRDEAGALRRPLRDRRRPGVPHHRPPRQRGGGLGGVPHRPRGDRRAALGPLVLVPLQVGAGDQRRRPDPHRAAARRGRRASSRSRSRRARTTCGLLPRVRRPRGERGPRSRRAPRRLHLRGRQCQRAGSGEAAPTSATPRTHEAESLSDYRIALRASTRREPAAAGRPLRCARGWPTWDDHEVEDNYADLDDGPGRAARGRRSAARGRISRVLGAPAACRARASRSDENMRPLSDARDWGALATFHVHRHAAVPRRPVGPAMRPREPDGFRATARSSSIDESAAARRRAARLAAEGARRAADRRLERARQPGRLRAARTTLLRDRRQARSDSTAGTATPATASGCSNSSRPRSCATSSSSPATSTSTRSATCPQHYADIRRSDRSRPSSSARRSPAAPTRA